MTVVAHAPFRLPATDRYPTREPLDLPNAACRSLNPDLFYPAGHSARYANQIATAKAICAACPDRQPCLAYALTHDEQHGIWGGYTANERRELRHEAHR